MREKDIDTGEREKSLFRFTLKNPESLQKAMASTQASGAGAAAQFLKDFSLLEMHQEMKERGITLAWMIGRLHEIASDPDAHPSSVMRAIDKLRAMQVTAAECVDEYMNDSVGSTDLTHNPFRFLDASKEAASG
jgi:hypothetical protein